MFQSSRILGATMNVSAAIVLVLVTLSAKIEARVIKGNGCAVSIDYSIGDLHDPQPLVLVKEKNKTDFLHPADDGRILKLKTGDNVFFACTGKGNYLSGIRGSKNFSEIEAECVRGKTFRTDSTPFNFTSLACTYIPKHEARRTRKRCHGTDTHVEIGFNLKNEVLPTIEICRNDQTMMTVWSKFRLTSKIAGYQSGYPRPYTWQSENFYEKYNLKYQYKSSTQVKTMAKLVGSTELANKYIKAADGYYLARGHLTAKADFVYGSAQMSTFWYLNAAPQWQTFNGGNWNTLEDSVRRYAAKRGSDLEVYTGTHGQMSLKDVNGNYVPIYLYANGTQKAFPVPRFFWKIIHDPIAKKATAFVGLNDPWAEEITEDMFICENIGDKIKWLNWQENNIAKGVSYACTVDDLRKSVPTVPRLSINGILT